jgi:hypothetical protein
MIFVSLRRLQLCESILSEASLGSFAAIGS